MNPHEVQIQSCLVACLHRPGRLARGRALDRVGAVSDRAQARQPEPGPAEAINTGRAVDAPARRLGDPAAARRQARRAGARGAAAEAQRGGRVHARRLGLPGRRRRPRGRRGRDRLPRVRACASWPRRRASSWPAPTSSSVRPLDHPGDGRRPASTPGSSSPWRRRTRRRSRTASRRPTRPGSQPQAALDAYAAGELPLVFPTIKQLESLLPFSSSEEAIEAAPRAQRRADPAEGDRQQGGPPGRPSGRPRLPA